jgi:hypothetical protein
MVICGIRAPVNRSDPEVICYLSSREYLCSYARDAVAFLADIFSVYVEHSTRYVYVFHLPSIWIPDRPVMAFEQIRVYSQVFGECTSYFLDAVFVTIYLYKIRNP